MSRQDRLSRIKSNAFARGLALAKVSVSAGIRAASHTVGSVFSSESEKSDRFKEMLLAQMQDLTHELGQLKGSLMKVGQLLSVYGEHFLPPEVNQVLKSLQNQSPPLEWKAIEKVLRQRFPEEVLREIEIEPEPLASASLGQVHRARRKSDGRWLAMKIQYPGVDQAIENDLRALKTILSVSKLIPKGPKYDEIFKEVRYMLHQEVDYDREREFTEEFRRNLADDPRYMIPETIPEFSNSRVLTTALISGVAVDSLEVQQLSQERRNAIGAAALDLYFRELFEFGAVQTDPHFGNYQIQLRTETAGANDSEPGPSAFNASAFNTSGPNTSDRPEKYDRLVLLDFGAVRKLSRKFLDSYLEIVRGTHLRDPEMIISGAIGLGFVRPEDSEDLRGIFVELCYLITEPFYGPDTPGVRSDLFDASGAYLWGESDLPKRVARKGAELSFAFKLRSPPREVVFLDRKLGGMFVFLSVLKVKLNGRKIIQRYI